MLKEIWMGEFLHEAENTRKLLKAIPDSALNWKPGENKWTTAELASHIVSIYNWYPPVLEQTEFKLDQHQYQREDITKASNILAKFEENLKLAQQTLERFDETKAKELWKMTHGGHELIPATPRLAIFRNMLCNHLYHHRGELIVYLRMTGNRVPGLYGPTADDAQ